METAYEDIKTIENMFAVMPIKFSKKSSSFLIEFISLCKNALINTHSLNFLHLVSRLLRIGEPIPSNSSYDYIPQEIRKSRHMEFAPKKHIHITTVKIKQRTYNFLVVQFENASSSILTQEAIHIVKQACIWLLVASNYAPANCSNTMNINLYLTDLKKVLPENKQDVIDMVHVNTAFTTSCSKNTTINIFRKEEWFKVLIHETFHNLGMDFSEKQELSNIAKNEILKVFHIHSDLRLYETYCEMWAEIINVIIRNTSKHMRMLSGNIIKFVEYDLQMERAFSLFQTAKLLHHFKIKYSDFLKSDSTVTEKYRERTEAFSYYVLKSIIMFDVNKFIEWCITNNNNVLHFNNPETHIVKYSRELILSQYNKPDFLRAIENVAESSFSNNKKIKKINFMYKTMRMTVMG